MNIITRWEWEQRSRVTVSDLIELLAHLMGCEQPEMAGILSAVIAFDKNAPCFTLIESTGDGEVITERHSIGVFEAATRRITIGELVEELISENVRRR